jgi:hypothetical protein
MACVSQPEAGECARPGLRFQRRVCGWRPAVGEARGWLRWLLSYYNWHWDYVRMPIKVAGQRAEQTRD